MDALQSDTNALPQNNRGPLAPLERPLEQPREEETSAAVVEGGSFAQAVAGLATVALAIIGLANVFPFITAPVAVIVVAAGLMLQGGAMATRYAKLLRCAARNRVAPGGLGSGMSSHLAGGIAGIVLGILALVQVVPVVLTAVAVLVFGAAVLLGCGANFALNNLVVRTWSRDNTISHEVVRAMASAATGAEALVGLAAVVLGIIAICGFAPMTLSLVGLLCLGAGVTLSGLALGGKMLAMVQD